MKYGTHCTPSRILAGTVAFALALGLAAAHVRAQSVPLFKDGDRVCFIGDSITHGDLGSPDYHELIYLYYATRFPDRAFALFDRGISGDTSWGTVARFKEDIASTRPTVATIMLGMNDVNRGLYGSSPECAPDVQAKRDAAIERYGKSMEELCKLVLGTRSRLVLFTPSPFDQTSDSPGGGPGARSADKPRVNDGLVRCAELCQKLGRELNVPVVDMNGAMVQIAAEQQKRDPTFSLQPGDRVHAGALGHYVMAYLFLKAQNAPAVVSIVTIDAAGGKVGVQENCAVSGLTVAGDAVRFTVAAKALPFPMDDLSEQEIAVAPFMQDLNREILCVIGLKPGAYVLKIDGETVGCYEAAQLAGRINLAGNRNTPQYRQAAQVAALNTERDNLSTKLRGLALIDAKNLNSFKGDKTDMAAVRAFFDQTLAGMEGKPWHPFFKTQFANYIVNKPEAGKIEAELAERAARLYQINRPTPHQYELARIGDTLPLPEPEKIAEPEGLAFHLPFDRSLAAADDPTCKPNEPAQATYEAGPVGDAVIVADKNGLTYPEPESFPLNAQTIAFWVKPHWDVTNQQTKASLFRRNSEQQVGARAANAQTFGVGFTATEPKDKVKVTYNSSPGLLPDGTFPPGIGWSQAWSPVENWGTGRWLHVCVTVDKRGGTAGTRLYVNGESAFSWTWPTPPEAHSPTMTFGGGQAVSLDDFRGYNRVLSSREIYALYRRGAARARYLDRAKAGNR